MLCFFVPFLFYFFLALGVCLAAEHCLLENIFSDVFREAIWDASQSNTIFCISELCAVAKLLAFLRGDVIIITHGWFVGCFPCLPLLFQSLVQTQSGGAENTARPCMGEETTLIMAASSSPTH